MEVSVIKTILAAAPEAVSVVAVIIVVTLFLRWIKEEQERCNARADKSEKLFSEQFNAQAQKHYESIQSLTDACHLHQTAMIDRVESITTSCYQAHSDMRECIDSNTKVLGEINGVLSVIKSER